MAVKVTYTRNVEVFGPTCSVCRKQHSVKVVERDLQKYESGKGNIQQCFPYLNPDEREILISGVNGECWDKLFGSGEE